MDTGVSVSHGQADRGEGGGPSASCVAAPAPAPLRGSEPRACGLVKDKQGSRSSGWRHRRRLGLQRSWDELYLREFLWSSQRLVLINAGKQDFLSM